MIIVETGEIVANANSYVSIADADAYFNGLGTDWDGADEAGKERALIKGRRALDQLYGKMYISIPRTQTQALPHPRWVTYDKYGIWRMQDTVYQEVKDAQCEAALMYLIDPLSLYPEEDNGGSIRQLSVNVGDVSRSVSYGGVVKSSQYKGMRVIEQTLAPILDDGNGTTFLTL